MRMLSNWKQRLVVGMLIQFMVWLTACGAGSPGSASSGTAQVGTVTGQVVSASTNTAVAGATVSTTAGSATSASDGSFSVAAPAGDRSVLHVEANGFAEAFPVARVAVNQTTTLGVKLLPTGVSTTVSVASGGTVTVPNSTAQVELPPNGLVPKNGGAVAGTVNVTVTPINPAVDPNLMPGDYTGVSAGGGGAEPIESFGAMVIDIRDNAGTRYNLAVGKTATIRIPLGTQNPNPPATIPLWYFDETTGMWVEQGTATLQGIAPDQYYEGTVTHFSTWNADQPALRTWVLGCVRDANGQLVANAWVQSKGIDYTGTDSRWTAADGTFRVGLRKGGTATISVVEWSLSPFSFGTISNPVTVTSSATDPTDFERSLPNCLVINPGVLTITTSVLAAGHEGVAYSQTLAATGGVLGYVWSLNAGSNPLPAGLSLNLSGVISGTPTTAGTTAITVKVTDSTGAIATKQLSIAINPPGVVPVTITSISPLPAGTVGLVSNTTLLASGGTGAKSWSVVSGSLPVGLTLNSSTGVISGTPTTQGTSTFTVRVQDSGNPPQSDQKQFNLTVNTSSGGGGGGTLTVSNAPASVGGTFVADPQFTTVNVQNNIVGNNIVVMGWAEASTINLGHVESIGFGADLNNSQIQSVGFAVVDGGVGVGVGWGCAGFSTSTNACNGVTLNRTAGTVMFANTVLTDLATGAPPITLNGTLNFTPF